MPDAFKDLTGLAAKAGTNGGAGFLARTGTVWSYPGAPRDPATRLPEQHVDHARVQAAMTEGSWRGVKLDPNGEVDMICPLSSPAGQRIERPISAVDVGTARAAMLE